MLRKSESTYLSAQSPAQFTVSPGCVCAGQEGMYLMPNILTSPRLHPLPLTATKGHIHYTAIHKRQALFRYLRNQQGDSTMTTMPSVPRAVIFKCVISPGPRNHAARWVTADQLYQGLGGSDPAPTRDCKHCSWRPRVSSPAPLHQVGRPAPGAHRYLDILSYKSRGQATHL